MDDLIAFTMPQQPPSLQSAIQHYGKRLFAFIRSRVKNDEDAEDILQDVWYKLLSIIDTEPIEQLSAWLYRVSRNTIVDKNRKHQPQSLEDLAFEDEDGALMFPDELLTDFMNPHTALENADFREIFLKVLSELPEKQREVFVWNELEDMTLQQIADKTGESIKTILSRKRYAVIQLRKRLQRIYINY